MINPFQKKPVFPPLGRSFQALAAAIRNQVDLLPRNCNVCGEPASPGMWVSPLSPPPSYMPLCGECSQKASELLFAPAIQELLNLQPPEVICKKCNSHIRACGCEENIKLSGLQK